MQAKQITLLVSILTIIFLTTSVSHAQTTHEDEPGFFTPVVESLYLQGGIFEDAQLIGPAVGYRFNSNYDISLHTEFLFSEWKAGNSNNPQLSILNLGVTAGQTNRWDNNLLLRTELSAYQSVNLKLKNYQGLTTSFINLCAWGFIHI